MSRTSRRWYVAAQNPLDPGVLILSKFAGAVQQLKDALIVNPYDKFEIAEAIREALFMDQRERVARWRGCSRRSPNTASPGGPTPSSGSSASKGSATSSPGRTPEKAAPRRCRGGGSRLTDLPCRHPCREQAAGVLLTGGGPADLTHVLATLGLRYLRLDRIDMAMAAIIFALPFVLPFVVLLMKRLSR